MKGTFFYIFIYIFFSPLYILFKINKILTEKMFKFFSPLMKFSPFLCSLLSIFVALLFKILNLFFKNISVVGFLFILGFLYSNHLLVSVTSFKPKEKTFVDINYLLNFLFIVISSVVFLLLSLRICFSNFSFISIVISSVNSYITLLKMVFAQLFIPPIQESI